jgi:hypothetical protein
MADERYDIKIYKSIALREVGCKSQLDYGSQVL